MSNIFQIADYIVCNYSAYPGGITPMKLQKLLYYLKAWGLVAGIPIVPEHFTKWTYGPVNKEVYENYKNFGGSPIPPANLPTKTIAHQDFADFVLESYAPYSALTLSALTHQEDPWLKTDNQAVISDDLVKSYYENQHFAKNFPLKEGNPYYPVLTDMYYSFIMDMDQDKVKPPVYASFESYKAMTGDANAEIQKSFQVFLKSNHSL